MQPAAAVKGSLFASAMAAIAASLCCVGPLVLVMLGAGGAWVSNLRVLEPWRPLFIGLTVVFIVGLRTLIVSGWRRALTIVSVPVVAHALGYVPPLMAIMPCGAKKFCPAFAVNKSAGTPERLPFTLMR